MLEVCLECCDVRSLYPFDAVAEDIPIEDFFVDVGEEDAASELGEVCVLLDECLGVENYGGL